MTMLFLETSGDETCWCNQFLRIKAVWGFLGGSGPAMGVSDAFWSGILDHVEHGWSSLGQLQRRSKGAGGERSTPKMMVRSACKQLYGLLRVGCMGSLNRRMHS